jgi:hypothetical protein
MTGQELNRLAGGVRGIATSMRQLGVDMQALETTAAAFQLFSGVGQVVKGLIAAKQAYNVIRAAEGAAHLAKYTVGAIAVAAAAAAGGAAMGVMIDRAVEMHVTDDGAGMRALAGGRGNA